nr:MAG TPA: hypothetical protein [Caudoviricetes sp.]
MALLKQSKLCRAMKASLRLLRSPMVFTQLPIWQRAQRQSHLALMASAQRLLLLLTPGR